MLTHAKCRVCVRVGLRAVCNRYGEDIGTPRTSTKPKLVNALEGLTVMQVAMGLGHSLLLAE